MLPIAVLPNIDVRIVCLAQTRSLLAFGLVFLTRAVAGGSSIEAALACGIHTVLNISRMGYPLTMASAVKQ